MLSPALVLIALLWSTVGIIANSPAFQEVKGPTVARNPLNAAAQHYTDTLNRWLTVPDSCWPGNAVSEFQAQRCEVFWNSLTYSSLLALYPLLVAVVLLIWGLSSLSLVYRRVQKQLDHNQAHFSGTVTQPPETSEDLFSWLFCFRPTSIQIPNGHQVKVYVSLDDPAPRPGETLAVFTAGVWWGQKRYVAILYAPHVSIVRA